VCYSNRAKTELAGVPDEMIREHGAVSEAVAESLADGIRSRAGTNVGIGITGIAGPGGGTAEKPVGTVCIAVVVRSGDGAPDEHDARWVRTFAFFGGREMVKFQATQAAMNMLRLTLLRSEA
jgi:nicotinamide-nucleotide amidase